VLVSAIAAVRDSVVLVLREPSGNGLAALGAVGTASYIGSDLFLTAAHLFGAPDLSPNEMISVGVVPVRDRKVTSLGPAILEFLDEHRDLALLRVAGVADSLPAARVSVGIEPDGRSVFCYGFVNPTIVVDEGAIVLDESSNKRASTAIVGGRRFDYGKAYELDGATYPGESGGPVFRQHDQVVVAVITHSRMAVVPASRFEPLRLVRGPTVAMPLESLEAELKSRGVVPVP